MAAYILRRLWQMIPTIFGVVLLVFFLFKYFGGDPAEILGGLNATPEQIAAIRQQLGLDQPFFVQFWHFLVNAAQAAESGPLSAEVRIVPCDRDGFVGVRIRDSGAGVPLEMAGRIFEPFVTTKGPGEGSGLGLWVSLGLARSAGGELVLENPGSSGACFSILLPEIGRAHV